MELRLKPGLFLTGLLLTSLAGCKDQYAGRMEVTGSVKLAGQPLKGGTISFIPLDGQDTRSGAPIENGEYKIPRESGLKPGNYQVQITAPDGKTPMNEAEAAGPGGSTNIVSVDLVPEDWNVRPTHTEMISKDGPNKKNFDIPNINPKAKKR